MTHTHSSRTVFVVAITGLSIMITWPAKALPAPDRPARIVDNDKHEAQRQAVDAANDKREAAMPAPAKGRKGREDEDDGQLPINVTVKKILNADGSGVLDVFVEAPYLAMIHGKGQIPAGDVRDRRLASFTVSSRELSVFESPEENPIDHQNEVTWKKTATGFRYEEEFESQNLAAIISRGVVQGYRNSPMNQIMQQINANATFSVFKNPRRAIVSVTVPGPVTSHNGDTLSEDKRTVTWDFVKRGLEDAVTLKIECGPENESAKQYRATEFKRLVDASEEEPDMPNNNTRPIQGGQLVKKKFVRQMKARVSDLDPDDRSGPLKRGGVRVNTVDEDSPAKTAGLKEDDVIIRINDRATRDYSAMTKALKRGRKVGEIAIKLTVIRNDQEKELPEFTPSEE